MRKYFACSCTGCCHAVRILYRLMTAGLNKDIQCQNDQTLLQCLQITRLDIRPHDIVKWAVSLVITGGHNLPQGFVVECMDYHTRLTTPEGVMGLGDLL